MINISKSGNAIKFVFTDNDHYLYGNGEIEVPVNSLSLIVDESKMVTFRKANSNDIFLSFDPANSNLSDKAGVINFYKTDMVGSTGGGSGSGMTPSEVQEMIDESVSGKADTAVVNQAISEATQAILSVSGDVQTKVATTDFNTYSAATATALGNKQDALQYYSETDDGDGGKESIINISQGTGDDAVHSTISVDNYYSDDDKSSYIDVFTQAQTIEGIKQSDIQISTDNGMQLYYDDLPTEGDAKSAHFDMGSFGDASQITFESISGENSTNINILPTGVTINDERVLTEGDVDNALNSGSTNPVQNAVITQVLNNKLDASAYTPTDLSQYWTSAQTQTAIDGVKAYYIDFATLTTQGIHDSDWDAMVAAINAHRPIYAGLGSRYYTAECLYQNGSNQIIMTASDSEVHYFYTFTKNGSENYDFAYETRPYVTDAEKVTWNAKQDALSAGTGIEISGNVISATGGGGATYSAGQGISIDTANTISFGVPIYSGATGSVFHPTYNNNSILIGNSNNRASNVSVAGGNSCTGQSYSFTYGAFNSATGSTSIALGNRVEATNDREAAFGSYNVSNKANTTFGDSGNTLFSVGNGSDSARHNAFEIRQNGDIYITSGNTDIKLQDHLGGGGSVTVDPTLDSGSTNPVANSAITNAITAHTADTTVHVTAGEKNTWNTAASNASDAINALGGLKLVNLTQAQYDQLVNDGATDPKTLYFISNVVS